MACDGEPGLRPHNSVLLMEGLVIECFQCRGVGSVVESFPDYDSVTDEAIDNSTSSTCNVCSGRGYLGVMTSGEFLRKHPRNKRTVP